MILLTSLNGELYVNKTMLIFDLDLVWLFFVLFKTQISIQSTL